MLKQMIIQLFATVLPFGFPSILKDTPPGALLSRDELLKCAIRYDALERTRLRLRLKLAELRFNEAAEGLGNLTRPKHVAKDQTDQQLDEIEQRLSKDRAGVMDAIGQFAKGQNAFFAAYGAFNEDCASRAYRIEDARALFPRGISPL